MVSDVMLARDWHFSFETSRFWDFCQLFEILVSENFDPKKKRIWKIWSKKKSRFRKIWSRKKVSVLVLENVVSEKSLGFGKIWYRKRKNQNTIPSKQYTSLIWVLIFFVFLLSLRWRKANTATLTLYSRGKEKRRGKRRKIFAEGEYLFF